MWRFFIAVISSVICIWVASIFLGAPANEEEYDSETGLLLPVNGSSICRFTEGGAISRYGHHGFNKIMCYLPINDGRFFMLYGDSFIEALQVADENKPDIALTRDLNYSALAYGTGHSGFGLPSMIVRAQEFERGFGKPIAHLFFMASGIRDDLFNDGGHEWRRSVNGYEKKAYHLGKVYLKIKSIICRCRLDFVTVTYFVLKNYFESFSAKSPIGDANTIQDISRELDFAFGSIAKLESPSVVVYCPRLPKIKGGVVSFDNPESEDYAVLQQKAKQYGIYLVDVTPAIKKLYIERNLSAHGFPNAGGPISGHLNEEGIKTVFGYVAQKLKEHYVF